MIGNAFRFLRYSVKCMTVWSAPERTKRERPREHPAIRTAVTGVALGLFVTMPLWMVMLGWI